MTRDTRRRMVAGAARMIGVGGVDALSLRRLAEQEGVPLGSTYHYFPGGKAELVDEAIAAVGAQVDRLLQSGREQGAAHVLGLFVANWRTVLEASDFRAGCPVVAAATSTDPRHHQAARAVFDDWHRTLADVLVDARVPAARAPRLARTIVAAIEGGVALARAAGTIEPLDEVVAELADLIDAAARD